jgi:hypothetical protein
LQQYRYRWSIGIYTGDTPLTLKPTDKRNRPALSVHDVTDATAHAVADPFMLRRSDAIYMFFEMLNAATGRGEIAYASSADGLAWQYGAVVLRELFHLSYPLVFAWEDHIYMVPETRQVREVRLYRARSFPFEWDAVATLLHGEFADSTLHHDGERWWLFAQRGLDELRLYWAAAPHGPWREHPYSPLWAGNRSRTRPGGRLIAFDGRLIRLAQDAWPSYGSALRAFAISRLDPTGYAEDELPQSPLFAASRSGWNALAMHHLDAMLIGDGQWLGAVDGATLALI